MFSNGGVFDAFSDLAGVGNLGVGDGRCVQETSVFLKKSFLFQLLMTSGTPFLPALLCGGDSSLKNAELGLYTRFAFL